MVDLELFGVSAALLIIGLVQLAKGVGFKAQYAGLLAVGLGVIAALGFNYFQEAGWFRAVVLGLAVGLSAAGLWSTTKNAAGG